MREKGLPMVALWSPIKRNIIQSALITLLGCASLNSIYCREKPNIIMFYIDDMGWKDIECNGSPYAKTPNINKLASEGMIFTHAYANAPNCAPSRACMLSGQYTPRHGVFTVNNSDQGKAEDRRLIPVPNPTDYIPDEKYTFAEALKTVGYASASIGKWHIGEDPTSQGFSLNKGGSGAGSLGSGGFFSPYNNLPNLPNGPNGEYLTDRLTDEAIAFIDANRNKPFLLYLSHYAVHTPIESKQDKTDKYKALYPSIPGKWAKYLGMIESVDESVARVLARIKQLNLENNTAVIFYSDNGAHPSFTSLAPLRGTKGMLYEGGIRVPFIFKWPGTVAPGTTCDVSIAGTDLYPTFLEMSGAQVPNGYTLDGESIMPLLTQSGSLKREALFWHSPIYLRKAYSEINYRFRETPSSAMIKGPWKLIEYFETGNMELFNLREDISEAKDLAEFLPDTVAALHSLLKQWRQETKAPMTPNKNPQFSRLFNYKSLPKNGTILNAGTNDSIVTSISGDCMKKEIDSVILKIYHNASLYKKQIQKTKFSNGKSPFTFRPKLAASKNPYKLKVYFIRKVIEEVDTIIPRVIVKNDNTPIESILGGVASQPYVSVIQSIGSKSICLQYNYEKKETVEIRIWDGRGRLYFSQRLPQIRDIQKIISFREQSCGIYFVNVSGGELNKTVPIIISD